MCFILLLIFTLKDSQCLRTSLVPFWLWEQCSDTPLEDFYFFPEITEHRQAEYYYWSEIVIRSQSVRNVIDHSVFHWFLHRTLQMGLEWGQFIRVPLFYLGLLDPSNLSPWVSGIMREVWQCEVLSHVRLFVTPWTVARRLLCPWNSTGKNAGVDPGSLLQGIFPTQGLNSGLQHCRQILYHLSYQRNPSWGKGEG